MGNKPSQIEGSFNPHRDDTGHSSRGRSLSQTTTVLSDGTVGSVRDESTLTSDSDVKAEPWTSEAGSDFSASSSPTGTSTPCPTELPPPRTMEGAQKMLTRIYAMFWHRDVQVKALVTGLGGDIDIYPYTGVGGDLVQQLKMTTYELQSLDTDLSSKAVRQDGARVIWSPKLLGDAFAVLDGYRRLMEDIEDFCGRMRERLALEQMPEASDLKWVTKNVKPEAVKLAARVKQMLSRLQLLRFDLERESLGI